MPLMLSVLCPKYINSDVHCVWRGYITQWTAPGELRSFPRAFNAYLVGYGYGNVRPTDPS